MNRIKKWLKIRELKKRFNDVTIEYLRYAMDSNKAYDEGDYIKYRNHKKVIRNKLKEREKIRLEIIELISY